MTTFTVAHVSGRFDAPRGPLAAWLDKYDPDVCGHTEVNKVDRATEITSADRRIRWDRRPRGDTRGNCAVSWTWSGESLNFNPAYRESFKCTDLTYFRVGGAKVTIWAPIVVLKIGGRNVLFSTIHLPSAVETKGGFARTQRTLVHRTAARGWRRECRRVAKKYDAERVMTGDFNISVFQQFATAWYQRTFPRLRGAEYARQGRLRATHGRRAIDRVMHSRGLRATSYQTTEELDGYDHRPIIVTLAFDERPRWRRRFGKVRQGGAR
jgi:hypothetical protein